MVYMKKIFISYNPNGKESDYINTLKNELESHEAQIYDTNYLETKYDNINSCDSFIAFVVGNSPNAMYDVGYAMSKNKKVLTVKADCSETSFFLEMASTILLRDYFDTSRDILNFVDNC